MQFLRHCRIVVTFFVFLIFMVGHVHSFQPITSPPVSETQPNNPNKRQKLIVSSANYEVALRLYKALSEEKDGENLFFSPWSVRQAMSLCYLGAGGETSKELRDALGFPKQVKSLSGLHALPSSEDDGTPLLTATGVWIQKGLGVSPDFKQSAVDTLQAGFQELDFEKDSAMAAQVINDWVEKRTEGMIPILFDKLDADDLLVLGSAVYFKAPWQNPFDPKTTKNKNFFPEKGKSVIIPMMSQTSFFFHHQSEECQIIEIPYEGTGLSFAIVLPDKGITLAELERSLDSAFLSSRFSSVEWKRITLSIPKFSASESYSLDRALQKMGIRRAFSVKDADFSKMTTTAIYLAQVQHKACLVVDEKGTEASATTAAQMRPKMVLPDPIEVSVDRPFMYMIVDRNQQTVYFMGRYVTPPKSNVKPDSPSGSIME